MESKQQDRTLPLKLSTPLQYYLQLHKVVAQIIRSSVLPVMLPGFTAGITWPFIEGLPDIPQHWQRRLCVTVSKGKK